MCIGIPMQVIVPFEGRAVCEGPGGVCEIDMALVGHQPQGTWVLVFLGAAREVVPAEQAALITGALMAVGLAMGGAPDVDIDSLFPDLANREPELPDFLKPQRNEAPPQEST